MKQKYSGYSKGRMYYCWARNFEAAKQYLKKQALKAVGSYQFIEYFIWNNNQKIKIGGK